MYQRPEAPQSIGGVLDEGFKLYRASLSGVVVFTFFAMAAGQLPNLVIDPAAVLPQFTTALAVALLVSLAASMLFYAAAVGRMDAVAEGRELSAGAALRLGVVKMLPLLVFMLLYAIIVTVGLLLLVVPGILFSVSLMFGSYVMVVEGKGPLAALGDSHRLVWGHWWRTLVILSVAAVIVMALYMLAIFVLGFLAALGTVDAGSSLLRLGELVLLPVLGAVVVPLFYALTLAIYYDLRLRRSGADLEARLGAAAEA